MNSASNCNAHYEETFFILPRYITKIPGCTFSFMKVFETMFQFWNKGKLCFLTNGTIKDRTGVCLTEIKEALNFLEKNKLLVRKLKEGRRFLMQPPKYIETDDDPDNNEKLKQSAPEKKQEVKQENNVRAILGGGRSTGQGVAALPATEEKNLNNLSISKVKHNSVDIIDEEKSENLFIFNTFKEKELLNLRNKYMKDDNRSDREFVNQCKFHINKQIEKGIDGGKAFFGLSKLIQGGVFTLPSGFVNVDDQNYYKNQMKLHDKLKHDAQVNSKQPLKSLEKSAIERFHSIPGIDRLIIKKLLKTSSNEFRTANQHFIESDARILQRHEKLIDELRNLKEFA